jgi:transcription elongation factor Elf1
MANCKSCGAEIEWIKTPQGKSHPVDASPKKLWQYTDHPVNNPWQLVDVYESHFATCPDANKHRKPKEPDLFQ